MGFSRNGFAALSLFLALAKGAAAQAQCQDATQCPRPANLSATEVLKGIEAKAKEIEKLRDALLSPDPPVRYAAFELMVESGVPEYAEMAIGAAFASREAAMRALAIRAAFRSIGLVVVNLSPLHKSDNPECELPTSELSVRFYEVSTGRFARFLESEIKTSGYSGQVSGDTITFDTGSEDGHCKGALMRIEGTWRFEGTVACLCAGVPNPFHGVFQLR